MTWTQRGALALASCGYLTFPCYRIRRGSPRCTGAGLIGTAAGLATVFMLPQELGRRLAVLAGITLVAVVVSDIAEEALGNQDDARIVIDEWAGYWWTLAGIPLSWPVLGIGFVLFRWLDVWKPWPVRSFCRLPGGWGIVIDDVLAGVAANLLLRAILVMWPGIA